MKRAIVIALATVAICVAATVILTRDDLRERHYALLVSRDESRFDEMLHDGGESERRAMKRFLRTEAGRASLARRCKDVLGLMHDDLPLSRERRSPCYRTRPSPARRSSAAAAC